MFAFMQFECIMQYIAVNVFVLYCSKWLEIQGGLKRIRFFFFNVMGHTKMNNFCKKKSVLIRFFTQKYRVSQHVIQRYPACDPVIQHMMQLSAIILTKRYVFENNFKHTYFSFY